MRRCPVCNWPHWKQDHYCRHCGYFVKKEPLLVLSRPLSWQQRIHHGMINLFRSVMSLSFIGILGVMGYWVWRWTRPMFFSPPAPDFPPALLFSPPPSPQPSFPQSRSPKGSAKP
jgi:hypothetical protein